MCVGMFKPSRDHGLYSYFSFYLFGNYNLQKESSANLLWSWGDHIAELRLEPLSGLLQLLHSVTNMCSTSVLVSVGSFLSWLLTNNTLKTQRVDSRAAAVMIGCVLQFTGPQVHG